MLGSLSRTAGGTSKGLSGAVQPGRQKGRVLTLAGDQKPHLGDSHAVVMS